MSLSACKATSEKQVDRIGDDEQKPITKSEAIQIVDDDTENDSLSAVCSLQNGIYYVKTAKCFRRISPLLLISMTGQM